MIPPGDDPKVLPQAHMGSGNASRVCFICYTFESYCKIIKFR